MFLYTELVNEQPIEKCLRLNYCKNDKSIVLSVYSWQQKYPPVYKRKARNHY